MMAVERTETQRSRHKNVSITVSISQYLNLIEIKELRAQFFADVPHNFEEDVEAKFKVDIREVDEIKAEVEVVVELVVDVLAVVVAAFLCNGKIS